MSIVDAATVFDDLRPYLHAVAYRLTSSWADAEDAVSDAWLRYAGRADEVDDPRAWLTRVVSRIALDHLRSARVRREAYVGPWLPEPLVTRAPSAGAMADPLDALVMDESVRLAFLVVLDRLTPEQRVALVLHDVLGVPFDEVAEVLGCSVAAARQHASRGRRRVDDADPPRRAPLAEAGALLAQLGEALTTGDTSRLVTLLAPDVVLTSDGAGQVSAAGRPVVGAAQVGGFLGGLVALAERHGITFTSELVLVNGDPGLVVRLDNPRERDPDVAVYGFAVEDGLVRRVYAVLAPDKLTRLPPPAPSVPPVETGTPPPPRTPRPS